MKVVAVKCRGRELKPGDLFSTAGPEYWGCVAERRSIGEKVYIRTETPSSNAQDADSFVYRITIEFEAEQAPEAPKAQA